MSHDLELYAQQWNPLAFYPTKLLITNHVGRIVPRKLWTSAGPHLLRFVGSLPVKVTENCAMTSATRAVTTAFLKSHSALGWRGNRTAVWLYSKCSWKFGGWTGWAEGEQQRLSRKAGCEAVWAQHLPSLVGLLPSIYEGRALDANINSSSAFPLQPLKNSNKSHCISYVSITVASTPVRSNLKMENFILAHNWDSFSLSWQNGGCYGGGITWEGSCHHSQPEVEYKATTRVV